jgi:FimV-like protein
VIKRVLKLGLISAILSLSLVASAEAYTTYGPVKRGETLWSIAKKTRPNHRVGVYTMMQAIEKLNPTAFDDLNKGTLHVGAKLQIPSNITELRAVLHGDASTNTASSTSSETQPAASTTASASSDEATAVTPTAPAAPAAKASNNSQQLQAAKQAQAAAEAQAAGLQTQIQTLQTQVTQLQGQLQQSQQTATELQQSNNQLQSQTSGFPWASLWFVLFVITGGYIVWQSRGRPQFKSTPERLEPKSGDEHLADDAILEEYEQVDGQNGSAIANAMIAMAEGDYKGAKRMLLNAIRKDHDNIELRMKLLEVYTHLNDRDAFNAESDYMLKNLINENDDAWKAVRAMYLKKWVYDN